jgi:HAT1-interacting factor 1
LFILVCVCVENFPQAILDFTSALALKLTLLPTSSRQISEAHLKLGVALEFDPADPTASRPKALEECEKAKRSLMERREELVEGRSKGVVSGRENGDVKGKGKGKEVVEEEKESLVKDRVEEMSGEERKGEITSIDEILTDLDVKVSSPLVSLHFLGLPTPFPPPILL